MGEQSLLLWFVFLFMILASVDAKSEGLVHCVHERNEQLVYGVQQDPNESRPKRQSDQQYQPFRIHVYYDSTVNTQLTTFQRNRLQNIVMPAVEFAIEAALSVIPADSPILLDRDCFGTFQLPIGSVRNCSTQCRSQTLCVRVPIPEAHLKRCVQCNGMAPNCETIGSDGPGVNNTDYILYVGTNPGSPCGPFSGVLAFANLCQMEATLDRPIAGAINFCPSQFAVRSDEENIRIGIHEVVHALGFSPTAYPFFRDEDGNPRTPRDQFGRPPTDALGNFVPSNATIRTTTYTDWQTRNGAINHEVLQFVTPNVVQQARIHYNCSTVEGVELENQGGGGTRSAHFEQRILGNEGMTGVLLFNVRFSRVTFGLMEDTGWYRANYNIAEPLAWGQNTGCIIPHGSCGEWIETQQQRGATLAPYCNYLRQSPFRLGCTVDRAIVSACNLVDRGAVPTEFQYFDSGPNFGATIAPRVGGSVTTPDYCPLQLPTTLIPGASRVCNLVTNQPAINIQAETYGPGSRCVEHGRQWFRTLNGANSTSAVYGGGCYQYSCSVSMGVRIQVLGQWFQCNCEGEELILNITGSLSGSRYQGSLICPSCGQLCFDNLGLCPNQEPAACYGQQNLISVSVTEPFTCYQGISSSGTCVNETGQALLASDCCNGLGGGAYMQNNGSCVLCPQLNTTVNNFYPFGISAGDIQFRRVDDGSSGPITLSTQIQFFETSESTLYVNTNGILSFRSQFTSFFPQRFPFFGSPLIAPFWDDVNINRFGNIFYRQTSDVTLLQRARDQIQELFSSFDNFTPTVLFIATWDRVAEFGGGSQENTFQVVIATDGQQTFVLFIYGDIEWGFANIGFNAGDGVRSFMVPGALSLQSRDIEEGSNVGRTGVYIYRVDQCSIRGPSNAGSGSGTVDCCRLPNPINGRVQFPDTTVGSVANYSCFFGYILNGTSTRTCEADGEWSGDPPTCDIVDCGPLDDPENGDVFVSGTRVGSSAYYYCFTGYRLIGSSFRTCLASGNWSGSAPICQVLPQFGLDRQLYSTAEGDEDLEVCVELLQGNITQRIFIGIGSSIQSAQFPSDVLPLNTSILTFDIGDTQECVPIQVVDDDLLEDTESIFVSIYSVSYYNATVLSNRSYAEVLIADNEVVLVGFNASSYTVDEGANQVQVCVRLSGTAELAQPVQMRVSSSKDGTATANEDFRPVLQLLTLPVGSSSGSTRCMPVYIIDDTEPETSEEIILTLFVADVAIVIARDGESTTVVIQDNDDFFIQFINDTPDVEGNQVTVSFTSSMPLASATCRTRPRPDQNCISQTAVFTGLPPNRRRPYDVIIIATSTFGQSVTISRQVRSGTINDCGAHLINQGVVVSGNSVTVEWQGTGPDPNNRVQDFQCSLDGGTFSSCTSPYVLTQLPAGEHVLRITPERSDCRRTFFQDVPFQIE